MQVQFPAKGHGVAFFCNWTRFNFFTTLTFFYETECKCQIFLLTNPYHGTKRRICNKFANVQICCKFNIQIWINFAVVVLLSLRHQICNTYTHAFTHTQIYGIKFAADLQWLFYYLYYIKFAIHTLINLHICKFIGSNLHQICNGCFVIFTIPNLQYIHTYFCTYANLSHQICIKFARVVYS